MVAAKKPTLRVVEKHGFKIKELTFREIMPVLELKDVNMSHEIAKVCIFKGTSKTPVGDELFDHGAGIVTYLLNTALTLNSVPTEKDPKN